MECRVNVELSSTFGASGIMAAVDTVLAPVLEKTGWEPGCRACGETSTTSKSPAPLGNGVKEVSQAPGAVFSGLGVSRKAPGRKSTRNLRALSRCLQASAESRRRGRFSELLAVKAPKSRSVGGPGPKMSQVPVSVPGTDSDLFESEHRYVSSKK